MAQFRKMKIDKRQRELRAKLWPEITEDDLWVRKTEDGDYTPGFATVPRTMPLMLAIMDDMAKNKPVSSTYLELFCRSSDDCVINLSKPREMSFHAGFTGQRAERTWKERMKMLNEMGFIKIQSGASGPMSYALIINPYKVIQKSYGTHPGVTADKYNALMARAIEIGAKDLDDNIQTSTSEKTSSAVKKRKKNAV